MHELLSNRTLYGLEMSQPHPFEPHTGDREIQALSRSPIFTLRPHALRRVEITTVLKGTGALLHGVGVPLLIRRDSDFTSFEPDGIS